MSKIAIVGAGSVGATIAYACLIRGVSNHIALYDVNKSKVESEVLDLNHGLQFVPMASVEGADELGVCRDASIVVITAGGGEGGGGGTEEGGGGAGGGGPVGWGEALGVVLGGTY